jgi:uncharacterized protein (TIGR03086 family)
MSEIARRYRRVASRFTEHVESVPASAWNDPTPCEGWLARDIVRHLVEWVPPFLHHGAGVALPPAPSADDDPVAAWRVVDDAIQALLDDPEAAGREFRNEHTGTHRLDEAIGMFVLGDVLVHTWDLARATGLDETLEADEVDRMLAGIEPLGDTLERSGHYAARVDVPPDAGPQARLLAATGRRP